MNSATDSAKDVKTKNDLSAISRAILTYQALNNSYPIEETPCDIGNGTCLNELVPNHIQSFPLDFNNNPYHYSSDGTSFTLIGALTNDRILTYNSETGYIESNGLPGYAKRQPITINSTSALTDYQVKLTITYDSDMQPDFDDLRFTASDKITELSYWLESKTDSTTATIWVKVPSLASGDNTIYIHYGNASVVTTSNGNNTFEFFDDFDAGLLDTNKWVPTGSPTITGGILRISTGNSVRTIDSFAQPNILMSRFNAEAGHTGQDLAVAMNINSWQGCAIHWSSSPIYYQMYNWASGNWGSVLENPSLGTYYVMELVWGDNNLRTKKNHASSWYTWTTPYISGAYNISLVAWATSGAPVGLFDWVAIHKYVLSEPTSSFGAEQNN